MRKAIVALLALWSAAAYAGLDAIDSEGRKLSLNAPAQRIVSLAPHITELLFAAGAGSKVVAVSEYSDYPEAARRLPRVANSSSIDLEQVLALRADLAIAWRLDATARALERLDALGIPVFYLEPHRLGEIADAVETLGNIAGTQAAAKPAAAALRLQLQRLRTQYRGRPIISVFYQISERPLMTLNGQHFVSDALALCGGRNVFADAPLIASAIGPEMVLAADPQAIIAARADFAETSWREFWQRFGAMRAVRHGNLLALHADAMHRHGPRAIAATERLCELLDEARARAGIKAASPR